MSTGDYDRIMGLAHAMEAALADGPELTDAEFSEFCKAWQSCIRQVKQVAYTPDPRNKQDVQNFEYSWGAQSAQFIVDLIPRIQTILVAHYRRADVLKLIDVGAGSCIGTNLLAALHSDHTVYSRFEIEAIDYIPVRKRWVQSQYPMIRYRAGDAHDLPDRNWDIVVCSHVVEHLEQPRPFIDALRRICRGFAFIYSPYNEIERIAAHRCTITEATYADIPACSTEVFRSVGWHPDRPADHCILATIDCRTPD